jgi:hypothetical protein
MLVGRCCSELSGRKLHREDNKVTNSVEAERICSFPLLRNCCVGDCQGLIQLVYREVYFMLLDDQGWRNHEVAYPGLDGDAALHHLGGYAIHHGWLSVDFVLLGVEGGFLFLIFHHF